MRRAVAAALLFALCVVVGAGAGCGPPQPEARVAQPSVEEFDPLAMTWDPTALASVTPALIGWRTHADGSGGELCVLNEPGLAGFVIWETPEAFTEGDVEIVEVAPDGSRMIGVLRMEAEGSDPATRTLLFDESGGMKELVPPAGFNEFSDADFVAGGILAIAHRSKADDVRTEVGVFDGEGRWQSLNIIGDFPEYQIVEACHSRWGSDLVGLVLKLPGGAGTRDDRMLVLARLSQGSLRVVTPAFYDDALSGGRPLWDADGIVYPRLWQTPEGVLAPSFLRVDWGGASWVEREVLPAGVVSFVAESGIAIAHDPAGGYWVRAPYDVHIQGSGLLSMPPGGQLTQTGIDVSRVSWFAWVQGAGQ